MLASLLLIDLRRDHKAVQSTLDTEALNSGLIFLRSAAAIVEQDDNFELTSVPNIVDRKSGDLLALLLGKARKPKPRHIDEVHIELALPNDPGDMVKV